jgi:hypothetical protein
MQESKTCTKCRQIKSLDNFSRHNGRKSAKSGYRATCKQCQVADNRSYRSRNREKVNQAKRKYSEANKEQKSESDKKYREANKKKIAKRNKTWRTNNYEHTREKSLEWRTRNKKRKAITDKAWAQNNKENVRNISMRRRARLAENGIFSVTKKDIVNLLNKGCSYCGRPAEHVDHIVPIVRGGTHSIGNLTGACASCNLSKGSKFVMEWKKGKK